MNKKELVSKINMHQLFEILVGLFFVGFLIKKRKVRDSLNTILNFSAQS